MHSLPETGYHRGNGNPVEELFYGRIAVERAMALHQLKYQGRKEIGIFLGKLIGSRIKESDFKQIPEVIIPVPLHKVKLRRRGFNQSALIAKGISEILNIPHNVSQLSSHGTRPKPEKDVTNDGKM